MSNSKNSGIEFRGNKLLAFRRQHRFSCSAVLIKGAASLRFTQTDRVDCKRIVCCKNSALICVCLLIRFLKEK